VSRSKSWGDRRVMGVRGEEVSAGIISTSCSSVVVQVEDAIELRLSCIALIAMSSAMVLPLHRVCEMVRVVKLLSVVVVSCALRRREGLEMSAVPSTWRNTNRLLPTMWSQMWRDSYLRAHSVTPIVSALCSA
jgi:hypothetical protein